MVHGYLYDGWRDDRLFHHTGEGQVGDQLMAQGNRAVRDHQEEGRELHVFEVSGGEATYVGESWVRRLLFRRRTRDQRRTGAQRDRLP